MPKKKNAFKPRIYPRRMTTGHYVFYIKHWVDDAPKFHRCHDDICKCGKPRPNRPCPHYLAAQEVLQSFEQRYTGQSIDAPIDYIIERWGKSNHDHRGNRTVDGNMTTYRLFAAFCQGKGYQKSSDLLERPQYTPLADFKHWMTVTPYTERRHTPESKKILRQIDYMVRRDGIRRDSPAYQQPLYQDKVIEMEGLLEVVQQNYSPSSVSKAMRELRVLFGYAVYEKLMVENPLDEKGKPHHARLVTTSKGDEKPRNPLTPAEQRLLMDNTEGDTHDMAVVFLYSGMRLGELINLQWGPHIRQKDGKQYIQIIEHGGWKPKWGKSRIIPMHPLVAQALQRQKDKHPDSRYCFSTTGRNGRLTRYGERNLQERFKTIFDKLGIRGTEGTGVSIHSMRHTFITRLVEVNETLPRVMQIAGHADIRTTMRYVHVLDRYKSAALESLT